MLLVAASFATLAQNNIDKGYDIKNGYLISTDAPMKDVLEALANHHHMKLKIIGSPITSHIHVELPIDSLSLSLHYLQTISGINHVIKGNKIKVGRQVHINRRCKDVIVDTPALKIPKKDTVINPIVEVRHYKEIPSIYSPWHNRYTLPEPAHTDLLIIYDLSNVQYKNKHIRDSLLHTEYQFLDYANNFGCGIIQIFVATKNSLLGNMREVDVKKLNKDRSSSAVSSN